MRYLAIDFGTKRLGLATCDPQEIVVSPYRALQRVGTRRDVAELLQIVRGLGIEAIVVGRPRALESDQIGANQNAADKFTAALQSALAETGSTIAIERWDEQFSTSEALKQGRELNISQQRGRDSSGADAIDARAAAVILQGFLDARRTRLASPVSDGAAATAPASTCSAPSE